MQSTLLSKAYQPRWWRRWRQGGMGLTLLLLCVTPGWAATQEDFAAVHYRLDVRLDPAARTLQGHVSVTAVWQGAQPLTVLYFFLPPNTLRRPDPREPAAFSDLRYARGFDPASLTVHSVADEAQHPLSFQVQDDPAMPVGRVPDQAVLRLALPRPYHAGERLGLTIAFTTRFPQAKNWGIYQGTVALDGFWYPMLVPHRRGTWIWGLQELIHAHYTLGLTAPADQQVVASVPWSERRQHQDGQTLSGSAGPLYQLGLSSSAVWHSAQDLTHTPMLRVVVPPADKAAAAHLLQTLRVVLAFYQQQFALVLPASTLSVVVHEHDLSWPFGAAADNLLFVSRDLVRVPSLVRKLVEYFVARGVAQQWWGLRTAYNLNTERWIGEGLTTYLAIRWLDHHYGPGRNFLTWKGAWLPNLAYREQAIEVPYRRLAVGQLEQPMVTPLSVTADSQGLRYLYEKKAALVYAMLHDLLGAPAFQDFLHLLTAAGGGILVTSTDVQHAAEAVSGRELGWFFQQWVQQTVQLDYAVGRVEVRPRVDALGHTVYLNQVEIQRVGDAVMPLTVRLLATDGRTYDTQISGTARHETVTWQHEAPLSDVHLDPERRLPDVQRLNNTSHLAYTVRPLIDFPRLDRYLLYPFVTLENNFIDGNIPRLHLIALYLDDQAASVSVGYKETPNELSVEGQLFRNRFPHPAMSSSLTFSDRQSARTLTLATSWLIEESRQQQRLPANLLTLGYRVTFLQELDEFNGETVPEDFAPDTGRSHSIVFRYQRDTRIPPAVGAPLEVFAEPLAYGYVLRLQVELAAELLGSTRPDFQQIRWEGSEYLRLWNQAWLQLRLFGGWSAGTIPLQRKLSLAGVDTVRGYPYRLRFLGDHLLGGTIGLRLPIVRDMRADLPGRYFGLRSVHLGPFVDGGWVWDDGDSLADVSLRSSAGVRVIAGIGFASLLRFEVVIDVAHPLDTRGREEDEGVQVWIRLQSTARGGVH